MDPSAIQRTSATPLYRQIYSLIRAEVTGGGYASGAPIPTEQRLALAFDVSRVTVRHAIGILAAEGLVVRQAGRGTFVAPPAIEEAQGDLIGFAEHMTTHPTQRMEVLRRDAVTPPPDIAEQLQLRRTQRVVRVRRRHLVRDEAVAIAVVHLPYRIGRAFTVDDLARTPIYTLIAEKTDERVARATQRVTAIAAPGEVAAELGIAVGAPVLSIRRLTFGTDGRPLEHIALASKGGRHELVMELARRGTQ